MEEEEEEGGRDRDMGTKREMREKRIDMKEGEEDEKLDGDGEGRRRRRRKVWRRKGERRGLR